ncbi:hypothetical protein [Streptomyces sp. NPDC056405]|uniref:hypothetical protein n=1 Tax=Streptomyces sp. NPDC056405 TaxID=3345811 RepID=UPI0035DFCF8F
MAFVRTNAQLTVGNGGIGHPRSLSSSWHNGSCPVRGKGDAVGDTFSATYQIDVLIQRDVVTDPESS